MMQRIGLPQKPRLKMSDLQVWLNPVDVAAKQRRKNVREMAAAYVSGKSITQISIDFGYATTTAQKMLRDYIPSQVDMNNFRMKFAAKKLRAKRIKGQI
jgi:hypothetical protein